MRAATEEIEELRRNSGACGREHDAKKDGLEAENRSLKVRVASLEKKAGKCRAADAESE